MRIRAFRKKTPISSRKCVVLHRARKEPLLDSYVVWLGTLCERGVCHEQDLRKSALHRKTPHRLSKNSVPNGQRPDGSRKKDNPGIAGQRISHAALV